jgi:ketosteroid isomerase-like protein
MNARQFAVIDRDGFFRGTTKVYSAHSTEKAAISQATRYRVSNPGNNPNQSCAMVIRTSEGGFCKGETIYADNIRRTYPVVW